MSHKNARKLLRKTAMITGFEDALYNEPIGIR